MEVEKIWKRFNISFILILPLFKNIIREIKSKDNFNISIHSLFCEYGLINTYILNSKGEYDSTLKLLFKKNDILVCNLLDKIDKPVASLLDLLISSEYFYTLKELDDYIVVYLKINEKWEDDIQKILSSNYSKVSNEYKEYVTYKGNYTLSEDKTINYLYLTNIPAKILLKHDSLQETIKDIFSYDEEKHGKLQEVFPSLNINAESIKI